MSARSGLAARVGRGALCGLSLLACSAPPAVEPARYLMRASEPAHSREVASAARIGLRRVEVAPYLELPGLAFETGPNQIRHARAHRWAEPLAWGLRSLLRDELSAALGSEIDPDPAGAARWQQTLDVDIDQLHGTTAGDALLVASWRVSGPGSGQGVRGRFTDREPLAREGYPALVEAEIALVRRLALAIAESLRTPGDGGAR